MSANVAEIIVETLQSAGAKRCGIQKHARRIARAASKDKANPVPLTDQSHIGRARMGAAL